MAILTPLFFVFRNYKVNKLKIINFENIFFRKFRAKLLQLFFSTSRFQLYFSSFEKLLEYARFFQALR